MLSVSHCTRAVNCIQHRKQRGMTANTQYRPDAAPGAAGALHQAGNDPQVVKFTAEQNYANMRSNLALLTQRFAPDTNSPEASITYMWYRLAPEYHLSQDQPSASRWQLKPPVVSRAQRINSCGSIQLMHSVP